MIQVRIDGTRVLCGRSGCLEWLGDVTAPRHVQLRGRGWHADQTVLPPRWRVARLRGRAKAEVRDEWGAYLPGGPTGYNVTYRAIVECPRCKAVQRIEE